MHLKMENNKQLFVHVNCFVIEFGHELRSIVVIHCDLLLIRNLLILTIIYLPRLIAYRLLLHRLYPLRHCTLP